MHTNHKREDPLVDLGYENRDVNYKAVKTTVISFFIFAFCCAMVGVVCYRYRFTIFNLKEPEKQQFARNIPADPNPLLQDNLNSKVDLMDLRQSERKRLDNTGYADDSRQTAHIPIAQAMEILAKQSGDASATEAPATPEQAAPSTTSPAEVSPTPQSAGSAPVNGDAAPPVTAPFGNGPGSAAPSEVSPTPSEAPATAPTHP